MNIARVVATRATCDRKHVGAVIVHDEDRRIIATGYNGAPYGMPHCDTVGHQLVSFNGRESCVRTIHAEANAIVQAARTGANTKGAELYTTASPCYDCFKLIVNAGISKVIYAEVYNSRYGLSEDVLNATNVRMYHLEEKGTNV